MLDVGTIGSMCTETCGMNETEGNGIRSYQLKKIMIFSIEIQIFDQVYLHIFAYRPTRTYLRTSKGVITDIG